MHTDIFIRLVSQLQKEIHIASKNLTKLYMEVNELNLTITIAYNARLPLKVLYNKKMFLSLNIIDLEEAQKSRKKRMSCNIKTIKILKGRGLIQEGGKR